MASFNSRTCEGATVLESVDGFLLAVSIHAPVKVRRGVIQQCRPLQRFNSRTCEGATRIPLYTETVMEVSIHAPVKVRQDLSLTHCRASWFQFTHL